MRSENKVTKAESRPTRGELDVTVSRIATSADVTELTRPERTLAGMVQEREGVLANVDKKALRVFSATKRVMRLTLGSAMEMRLVIVVTRSTIRPTSAMIAAWMVLPQVVGGVVVATGIIPMIPALTLTKTQNTKLNKVLTIEAVTLSNSSANRATIKINRGVTSPINVLITHRMQF